MALKKAVKRFTGVYVTESKRRRWRERPDRCYWINFKDGQTGKLRWERCGWASEGWTPEAAQRKRYEILEKDGAGKYKPKKERAKDKRTFRELAKTYLDWAEHNKKSWDVDKYRYYKHLDKSLGSKPLPAITPFMLEKLKRNLVEKGLSPASVKHCLVLIRQMFNKAAAWGLYSGPNPIKQVKLPKLNNRRLRFLTHEEAADMLDELEQESPQAHLLALVSLHTGMRLGEITALRWRDLDFSHGIIHIRESKPGPTEEASMTPTVKEALLAWRDEHASPTDLVFKGKNGQKLREAPEAFEKAVAGLGLNEGVESAVDKVVFHTLRHTFASWLASRGTPLNTIKELMRHRTIAMTERYSHLLPDVKKRAVLEMVSDFEEAQQNRNVPSGEGEAFHG